MSTSDKPVWLLLGYDVVTTTIYILGLVPACDRRAAIAEAEKRAVRDAKSDDCEVMVFNLREKSSLGMSVIGFLRRCKVPTSTHRRIVQDLGNALRRMLPAYRK